MNDIATGPENWFYVREGRRQGPFTRALLVRELLALEAPEGALVWRSGLPAWTKAGLVDALRRELPPPVPGTLPLPLPLPEPDQPAPDLPQEQAPSGDRADYDEGLEDGPVADGGIVPESPEEQALAAEPESGARRRRRQRSSRKAKASSLPSYALPLALLFIALMIALWFLLRRLNEVPPGRIILHGEVSDSRSGGTRA